MRNHLRRRRRYYLVGLGLLTAVGVWIVWATCGDDQVTKRNFALLVEGMSVQEVEALLGREVATPLPWSVFEPGVPPPNAVRNPRGTPRTLMRIWDRPATFFAPPVQVRIIFHDGRLLNAFWVENPWLPHVWSQLKQRLGF
jgi:hypothetical protein